MLRRLVAFLFCFSAFSAHATSSLSAVEYLDLDRFLGKWYEIAKAPKRFMSRCATDTTLEYRREGEELHFTVRCLTRRNKPEEVSGPFRIFENGNSGRIEVRFGPSFLGFLPGAWGDYWVFDINADYSVAIVGEPAHAYVWILARSPEITDEEYAGLLARLDELGFDTSRVVRSLRQDP